MPSLRALPQELIDKIIDELGEAHRDVSPDNHIDVAHEALHACTLVSKNWTGRSRTHLFKKVTIRADASGKSLIPPESLMPYIAELKIRMQCRRYHPFPSHKLLRPFHTAPITSLWITGGTLSPTKVPLVECIIALSATLHTVTFKSCSLSLSLILDIALKHPDLKRLHLRHCEVKPTNSDHHAAPRSDTHFTPLELGVFSGADSRGHELAVATVAQLPVRFGGLDFDYLQGPTVTRSSNALIGANAKSLSSLTAHIVNILWGPWKGESEPLFNLGDCFNLSELVLDMREVEGTSLGLVMAPTKILSTIDPKQSTRLERIKLITMCIRQWLCEVSRNQIAQAWSNLDIILSKLAKVATSIEGKKLTFVLGSMWKGECVPFGRKWLPELLPRFHELGELRVDVERASSEADADHCCFCDHQPVCPE